MSPLTWVLLLIGAHWLVTPEEVVRELRTETPAVLHALERTGAAVATLDPLTAPVRWSLGHLPVRDRAAALLARASADANRALDHAVAALGPTPGSRPRSGGVEGAVEAMATALTRSIAASFGAPPDGLAASQDAPEVWRGVEKTLRILKEARQRMAALAIWQLFYLVVELGLALGVAAAAGAWRPTAVSRHGVLPTPLAPPRSRLSVVTGAIEARVHPRLGPIGTFLKAHGLSHTLACEIDRSFRQHARWPGSLKGHDAASGGLIRHSLAVGLRMAEKARAEPREVRRAAAFLGVVHDLGKCVTYQPTEAGWTSHPAIPHDSLSARIVAGLDAFRRAFPDPVRRAILQALRDYHSDEVFAANAPPLARQFLQWLQEADTDAVERSASRAREAMPA